MISFRSSEEMKAAVINEEKYNNGETEKLI